MWQGAWSYKSFHKLLTLQASLVQLWKPHQMEQMRRRNFQAYLATSNARCICRHDAGEPPAPHGIPLNTVDAAADRHDAAADNGRYMAACTLQDGSSG